MLPHGMQECGFSFATRIAAHLENRASRSFRGAGAFQFDSATGPDWRHGETDMIKNMCSDPDTTPDAETLAAAIQPELQKWFKPAFLGRITVIPYFPLSDTIMRQIAVLKLGKIKKRIKEHYDAEFTWTEAVLDHIVSRCTEVDSGVRNVDKILNGTLLPQMSTQFLATMAEGNQISAVKVDVGEGNSFQFHCL